MSRKPRAKGRVLTTARAYTMGRGRVGQRQASIVIPLPPEIHPGERIAVVVEWRATGRNFHTDEAVK